MAGMNVPGGELEHSILSALWDAGKASAREVHATVGAPRGLVYTTIAKVLDRLLAKKLVKRKLVGRSFVYAASVGREKIERVRARESVRGILGLAPKPAIATLVDAVEAIDPELLDELARVVDARRRSRRGS